MRATYRAAVYVIPRRGDEILLFRRFNTGFGDGQYSFIAGHVEQGESVTATAIREAMEEAGIGLRVDDLHFGHILHRHSADGLVYFDFFFVADRWDGYPAVMEPHRCDEMVWAPWQDLPATTLPYIRSVIDQIFAQSHPFSEHGWSPSPIAEIEPNVWVHHALGPVQLSEE